jgi:APA family basic amino acid/polyamine antiporter
MQAIKLDLSPASRQQHGPGLKRVLGLAEVTAGGVGMIIGAGIYVLIGPATAVAGQGVWLSFIVAAAISALTAFSYMELSSMFPSAAAEYEYTRRALPERFAFLVGWMMISALIVAAAAVSLGFARYLSTFVALDVRIGALCLLAFATAVSIAGVRESARVTMLLTAVEVAGLGLVIAIGIPDFGKQSLVSGLAPAGVISAAALVFFAFIGFDDVIALAEETENPTRTMPLALALALSVSSLLYVSVAIAALSVLGPEALGASDRPLADVVEHSLGGISGRLMACFAMMSTINTVLLALTAASRMLYGMARMNALPPQLSRVSMTRHTPVAAIAMAAIVAAMFIILEDLTLVASVTDVAVYFGFLAVNVAVVVLRVRMPNHPRPFRIPGAISGIPVLPFFAFAVVVVMLTRLELRAIALAGLLALVGAVISLFRPGQDGPFGRSAGSPRP